MAKKEETLLSKAEKAHKLVNQMAMAYTLNRPSDFREFHKEAENLLLTIQVELEDLQTKK